jgi:hypothetical protein
MNSNSRRELCSRARRADFRGPCGAGRGRAEPGRAGRGSYRDDRRGRTRLDHHPPPTTLSLSLSLRPSHSLFLTLSRSLSLTLSVCLSACLAVSHSICLVISLSPLSLPPCLPSLSPSLPPLHPSRRTKARAMVSMLRLISCRSDRMCTCRARAAGRLGEGASQKCGPGSGRRPRPGRAGGDQAVGGTAERGVGRSARRGSGLWPTQILGPACVRVFWKGFRRISSSAVYLLPPYILANLLPRGDA